MGRGHAPRVSPDGELVAFNNADVHVYDFMRDTTTRLTSDGVSDKVAWHPNGSSVLHSSNNGLYLRRADGAGEAERLIASEFYVNANSWSPDARYVAYTVTHPATSLDIWVFPLNGEPMPFLVTEAAENAAQFSPDGRYIAYPSDESGTREIYVRPFLEGDARWKISSAGGTGPVWSRKWRRVFLPSEIGDDGRRRFDGR